LNGVIDLFFLLKRGEEKEIPIADSLNLRNKNNSKNRRRRRFP
jgi:hypothetical protein